MRRLISRCGFGLDGACKPEVEDLHLAVHRQHDVRWLQVAVSDSSFMRGDQNPSHPLGDLQFGGPVEPVLDSFAQALSVDELEHEVVGVVPLDIVVNLADIGARGAVPRGGIAPLPRASAGSARGSL